VCVCGSSAFLLCVSCRVLVPGLVCALVELAACLPLSQLVSSYACSGLVGCVACLAARVREWFGGEARDGQGGWGRWCL
jgi:hypothetical protein